MPSATLPPLPSSALSASHREPSASSRAATLAGVTLAHLAAGWALMQIDAVRQAVSAATPLMVNLVTAAPETPPPPAPPPPRAPQPMKPPPSVSLLAAKPRPLPTPEPLAFTAPEAPVEPAPPAPPVVEASPTPPAPTAPKIIPASEIQCPTPARPDYPAESSQLGETGTTLVRVLVDAAGRPQEIVLHKTSGHPRLDRAALAGARTLRCKPYTEAGVAQAVWVVAPIVFELD